MTDEQSVLLETIAVLTIDGVEAGNFLIKALFTGHDTVIVARATNPDNVPSYARDLLLDYNDRTHELRIAIDTLENECKVTHGRVIAIDENRTKDKRMFRFRFVGSRVSITPIIAAPRKPEPPKDTDS